MNIVANFSLTRRILSSYYIAAVVSIFLFQLIETQIINWADFVSNIFTNLTSNPVDSVTETWLIFLFSCFIITALIRQFIIEPLGFAVEDTEAPGWETAILAILVFGFFVYHLNLIFTQEAMPLWIPDFIVKAVGGFKPNTVRTVYNFVPWFWNLGPIIFLYLRTKVDFKLGE